MSSQLFSIVSRSGPERPRHDLEALLARMAQRRYPESIPVLASYWLKTVYGAGHKLPWWKELNRILKQTLREQELNEPSREALHDIRSWIEQAVLPATKLPATPRQPSESYRVRLKPEGLKAYVSRMLNQWLSSEIAWLLVNETAPADTSESGIPVLAIAKALERLLTRENLSPESLEMLLRYEALSPREVYPGDLEILSDVVLSKLGRTWAPPLPVMPARLLALPEGSHLPAHYREAVQHAAVVENRGSETIHVPIAAEQALQILECEPVRIGSILVTLDGRWWEPQNLQSGDQYSVVYKPAGRLRIDYTADHAKLHVPWPETRRQWSGGVHLAKPLEIFGREWRASSWETDGERSWLHLEFRRSLPVEERDLFVDKPFRRSSPAVVDMAWAALQNALADAVSRKNREAVEQLRRSEMIPLGRALFGFAEAVSNRWLPNREAIEAQLRAIRYLEAENSQRYGRVPWKVLPEAVQSAFLKKRPDAAMMELVGEAFVELPPALGTNPHTGPTSPSQAA